MRKLSIAAACALALATAGIAVGKGLGGAKTMNTVAGTFTATTAAKTDTKTCTTANGKTLVASHGRYSGAATGDADLTGPLMLDVHSLIDTTDDVGVVSGKLSVDVSGKNTDAHFDAVYDHGKLAGLARGHAHNPDMQLLANLSAGFSAAGGFTDGKLGGTAGGSALELGPGKCDPSKPAHDSGNKPPHDNGKTKDPPKHK
jgi:hypothetical protein